MQMFNVFRFIHTLFPALGDYDNENITNVMCISHEE